LWISDLDRVVARTGWSAKDLVVAMRSGPPSNHEHADRNSIIVKAHGQQLVTDPLRPPYSFADPAWPMRLTQGHSAVLIDGRGHEHHNGVEGTNASRSYARITTHESTGRYALWTSIATQPYRLVDVAIKDVVRSVVVLFEEEVIVVVDRVTKYERPSTLTARFFGDNGDGRYNRELRTDGFVVERPGAMLNAHIWASVDFEVIDGKPFVPNETARLHPFIDVVTDASMETMLVTAMSVGGRESAPSPTEIRQSGDAILVDAGSQTVRISPDSVAVL
jgi:hypothetical protein